MKQRVDEWNFLETDSYAKKYHLDQWVDPKRSTVKFSEFIYELIEKNALIVDLGCGAGAATYSIAKDHPDSLFLGVDLSNELIKYAKDNLQEKRCDNLSFDICNWFEIYQLNLLNKVDGVISLQTLSWMPNFKEPLNAIFLHLAPKWIAISSLFYEGEISYKIEVNELAKNKLSFYNIYSLPEINRFCLEHGYSIHLKQPFEIDINLPKSDDLNSMSTFTFEANLNGEIKILQQSGALLMNWYFILIKKNDND